LTVWNQDVKSLKYKDLWAVCSQLKLHGIKNATKDQMIKKLAFMHQFKTRYGKALEVLESSDRGDVILCCDTPGNEQKKELIYECGYEGYDGYDKSEGPDDIRDLMYVTERPVGDYERCHRFVRVLVKRLIGDFIIYGEYYNMMRHRLLLIDNVTSDKRVRLENTKISNYNF